MYQIKALKDFGDVKAGDLGGWIEKESNLNQDGNAWVSGNALVYGNALVSGNVRVYGDARVYGSARVTDNAKVCENMSVSYSIVTKDLSNRENLSHSLLTQCNIQTFNDESFVAYKHVNKDFSSLYDVDFKYTVGEYSEVQDADMSANSCASGLHVSCPTYWEGNNGKIVLMCRVLLNDIIAVQLGKIRCKKLFVIASTKENVF